MWIPEFARALSVLPDELRERAMSMRQFLAVNGCAQCRAIHDALDLAVVAARYDELAVAAAQIEAAEALALDHDMADCRALLDAQGRTSTRGRGLVARWSRAGGELVAATDASWKAGMTGFAYVVSDGRYGLLGRRPVPNDPTGRSRVLINELRAVEYLLSGFDGPPRRLTVLVDSVAALRYLRRWQAGDITAMPVGYDLRPRASGGKPTLVRLAEALPGLAGVTFAHVPAHTGHLLNEAADALSAMARRRQTESFELRKRAVSLVDAFLRDWHTDAPSSARAA